MDNSVTTKSIYGTLNITGGVIKNNTATGSGGGIDAYTVNMSGGVVSGNNAKGSGGGIYAPVFKKSSSGGTVYGSNATNIELRNTSGTGMGHAVCASTYPVKKRNLTVNANEALDSAKMTGWE